MSSHEVSELEWAKGTGSILISRVLGLTLIPVIFLVNRDKASLANASDVAQNLYQD